MSLLARLRQDSKLTIDQIIQAARQIDPDFPTSSPGYLVIEERGTRDYWKIHALASVFNVEPHHLAAALKPADRSKKVSKMLKNPLPAC